MSLERYLFKWRRQAGNWREFRHLAFTALANRNCNSRLRCPDGAWTTFGNTKTTTAEHPSDQFQDSCDHCWPRVSCLQSDIRSLGLGIPPHRFWRWRPDAISKAMSASGRASASTTFRDRSFIPRRSYLPSMANAGFARSPRRERLAGASRSGELSRTLQLPLRTHRIKSSPSGTGSYGSIFSMRREKLTYPSPLRSPSMKP